ncbi:GNAT family N-acetyltransferase [Deinococcus sp. QL22]|uniref:GNAT family N-acetyltransferase n=1 Tax=Deinococcus sp. QL22 TaxID=2939437 RepID=UPI00201819DE|nr:GNAT family N-acetyltransferase [Deinococcus sp. QL22]UQN09177.1 GNAT family N-acetyltransferase [Deinococcus sp. QL22]
MIQLRPAAAADALAVAQLHALSWRTAYRGQFSDAFLDGDILTDRTRLWTSRLQQPDQRQNVTVAELDGSLVGFSCIYSNDHPHWGTLLDNLHVQPTLKGTGIGAALLRKVARDCRAQSPASSLYLWVLDANHDARNFYEHQGGRCADEEVWSPPGGGKVKRLRYIWPADKLPLDPSSEFQQL